MRPAHLPSLPSPDRFGGPGWLQRTGGNLSLCQCLDGAFHAAGQQARNLFERVLPGAVRRISLDGMPQVPDSRLVRLAEEAAMEQPPLLRLHGFRSAAFARALAHGAGVAVDPELLFVCGLLHDAGIAPTVAGEDFTIRSAARAARVAAEAGWDNASRDSIADAILVHTTIGIRPDRDGALGCYTQWGAMVDLTGLGLVQLPRDFVREVFEQYPRGAFKREILSHFEAEVRAMPKGRFALAKRVGFGLAVQMAPFSS